MPVAGASPARTAGNDGKLQIRAPAALGNQALRCPIRRSQVQALVGERKSEQVSAVLAVWFRTRGLALSSHRLIFATFGIFFIEHLSHLRNNSCRILA
jgi:hypothetical protein